MFPLKNLTRKGLSVHPTVQAQPAAAMISTWKHVKMPSGWTHREMIPNEVRLINLM